MTLSINFGRKKNEIDSSENLWNVMNFAVVVVINIKYVIMRIVIIKLSSS